MTTGDTNAAQTSRSVPAPSADARVGVPRQFTPPDAAGAEGRRLAELHSLNILDSPPEPGFDDLVQLAAQITGCPVALVTLIDEQRQWFKARVGTDLCATDRDLAFCDHVVRDGSELEVPDLRRDPRFASNPFVVGPPHAVFYAGYPISTESGLILGTICVIDSAAHQLTDRQREQMRALARQVSTQLELRRLTIEQAHDIELRRDAATRIAQSEERFRSIFHGSPMGITLTDADGRLISANPAMCHLLGVAEQDLIGRLRSEFVHPADSNLHPDAMRELREKPGTSLEVEVRYQRYDGVLAWASAWLSWIDDGEPEPHLLAHVFDITDRRRAEQALSDSESNLAEISLVTRRILSGEPAREVIVAALVEIAGARLATLLERGGVGETVVTWSSDPRLIGQRFSDETASATAAVWLEEEALFIERAEEHPLVNQRLAQENAVKSLLYQPIKSGDEMIGLLSVSWDQELTDLTDRRLSAVALLADEAAFALEHDALLRRYQALAGTDQLTGLPNRRSWDERLAVLIAGARRSGEPFVVAVADVDRFKLYNDTHGHLEGDVLLREVAQATKAELRAVDTVARWGGEEFAIALPNCGDADARQVLERVRQSIPRGQSISIGYCQGDPAESLESLMNRADSALYEAKRSGRDRVVSAAELR